jgi:hypothetical protein
MTRETIARLIGIALLATWGTASNVRGALADVTVPLEIQADLLCKVVRFERQFVQRAGAEIKILIVDREANRKSVQAAKQLEQALGRVEIAGKKVKTVIVHYTAAASLKQAVAGESAAILFLTPGFESQLKDIATSLEGVRVITVSTDGDQVPGGVVLGFELVSSHPKIVINLAQAKKQKLDFNSDLFRLAKVFQ